MGGVLNCEFLGGRCGSSASALKQPFNAECAENAPTTAEKHLQIETSRLWTNVDVLVTRSYYQALPV